MIDYKNELNSAQYEAVSTLDGPVLVIAGAGSGKTRTIVYRLANMVQSGVPASSILLLTFTRKAAHEMLERARFLLGRDAGAALGVSEAGLAAVQGGTFHSFAYSVLRVFRPEGYAGEATVMDSGDSLALLQHCREELKAGKGDRSFPRNQTVQALLSKSRNREQSLEEILRREAAHLLPHAGDMLRMGAEYARLKRARSLLDYDDLLFEFEHLLRTRAEALNFCRRRHRYLMVDEFQDTNLVQARITALIAGAEPGAAGAEPGSGNILAVGDDAQSIYAFRGANVNNILNFPRTYPGTRLIRLEENYRSTQPLLDLSNNILDHAAHGFKKRLYTRQPGQELPQLLRPISDLSQGGLAAAKIVELLRDYPPSEIAVLFRAGYQSYHLEVQLNKLGLRFRKYGGIRYVDAAHVKDVMSFVRLVMNPLDFTAFRRVTDLVKGIGPKTSLKLHQALQTGDAKTLEKACAKYPDLRVHLDFLSKLRCLEPSPRLLLERVVEHYQPVLETLYPDDYPKRRQGLDELIQIAAAYADLDLLVADLSLEDPLAEEDIRDSVTLSTIHSAKGLEWGAVLILDLVEERFPSRHALAREEDYEEERRLLYVACTRAKKYLGLLVPCTLYERGSGGSVPAVPSPFVRELDPKLYEEWQESFTGGWSRRDPNRLRDAAGTPAALAGGTVRPCQFSRPLAQRFAPGPQGEGGREPADIFSLGAAVEAFPGREGASCAGPVPDCAKGAATVDEGLESGPAGPLSEPFDSEGPGGGDKSGYCRHKIFGRGKIVRFVPPDKYQVNFPGFGLKMIMGAYLSEED